MSRYFGPARIRIHGNQGAGAEYVGLARTLLGEQIAVHVSAYDSSRGLASRSKISNAYAPKPTDQIRRAVTLPNGVKIAVQYNTYMPIIDIWVSDEVDKEEIDEGRGYIIWPRDELTNRFGGLRDSLIQIDDYESGVPPISRLDTAKEASYVLWTDPITDIIYSCNPSGLSLFNESNTAAVRYRPRKLSFVHHPDSPGPTFVTTLRTIEYTVWGGTFWGSTDFHYSGKRVYLPDIRIVATGGYNGDMFIVGRRLSDDFLRVYRRENGEWLEEYSTGYEHAYCTVLFGTDGNILFTHAIQGQVRSTEVGSNNIEITNARVAKIDIVPTVSGDPKYSYILTERSHPQPILYYSLNMGGGFPEQPVSGTSTGQDHLCLDWDEDSTRVKSLYEKAKSGSYATRTYDDVNTYTVDVDWVSEVRYSKYAFGDPSPGILTSAIDTDIGEQEYVIGEYGIVGTVTGEKYPSGIEPECFVELYHPGGAVSGSYTSTQFLLVDADLRYDTICFIEAQVVYTPTSTEYVCSLSANNTAGPYVNMYLDTGVTTYTIKVWRKGSIVYQSEPFTYEAGPVQWNLADYTGFNSQQWSDRILGVHPDIAPVARYRQYPRSQLQGTYRPLASFLARDEYSFVLTIKWISPDASGSKLSSKAIFWQQPLGAVTPDVYEVTDLLATDGLDLQAVDIPTFTVYPIRAF